MDQNRYCSVCDLNLDPISYASHVAGKKHQRLANIQKRESYNSKTELMVTNFPPQCTKEQLVSFFEQYGEVRSGQFLNESTFVIRFRHWKTISLMPSCNLFIQGRRLFFKKPKAGLVKQKTPKRNRGEPSDSSETSSILSIVKSDKHFDEQVDDLIHILQDPQNVQQKKCDTVLRDLSNALNAWFPCELHKFGSTVTGLGLRNSDIDIFVNLLPHRPYNYEESMEYLKSTKRILSRSPSFYHVLGIFSAKTPIVKCEHGPTKVHCDINFKNSLGIHNSELIKYLQTLDARVKRMMLIVKWWAKHFYLTGSSKITNYALTMLVIYFLQQKGILPTVAFLQKDVLASKSEWNCSFNVDIGRVFTITNDESLVDLLAGFLKYYGEFDYAKIISPLTGMSYPREAFAKVDNLPEGFERYREKLIASQTNFLRLESSIVVIDPFELSHNVTPSTTENMLEDFIEACMMSCKCFEKNKDYKESEVLTKLFSMKLDKKGKSKPKDFEIQLLADSELSFQLQLAMKVNLDEVKNEWFNRTQALVLQVMKEVLALEIQTITASPERKTARKDDSLEVHDRNVSDCTKYRCLAFVSLLRSRKRVKTMNRGSSFLDQQIAISKSLLTEQLTRTPKPLADFNLVISKVTKPTRIVLRLTSNLPPKGEFMAIGDYCKKNLKKMLNRPLVPNSQSAIQNVAQQQQLNDKDSSVASTSDTKSPQKSTHSKKIKVRQDVMPPGFVWF